MTYVNCLKPLLFTNTLACNLNTERKASKINVYNITCNLSFMQEGMRKNT